MELIFQSILVLASLASTLILPPLFTAWTWRTDDRRWTVVLNAWILGCASQGLLGLFWNWKVQGYPAIEAAVYYGFWLAASWLAARTSGTKPVVMQRGGSEGKWFCAILMAGLCVRWVHPLGHAALGQSDAYSHLQFIRQVAADGMIHNQIYPPAYSWIMALPVLTFGVDPYDLARFGGAFWGVGLIGALVALARSEGKPWTGLMTGALVAVCPAWMPLMKTGVGAYANQAGLFLVPLVLLSYLRLGRRGSVVFLLILSAALVAAVPMMWISLVPVLAVDRLWAGASGESSWRKRTGCVAVALIPALCLLLWQSSRMQGLHRDVTVAIVTAGESLHSSPAGSAESRNHAPSAATVMLKNFLSIKRIGYGDVRMNAAGVGLGVLFGVVLYLGVRRKNSGWRLMGIWGLITSIQAGTGFLQFSGYQREGWALLMATAWLGGTVGGVLLDRWKERKELRGVVAGVFAVCFLWTVFHPPGHAASFSTVEDELIDVVRSVVLHGKNDRPLTIVARPFTGFHGNQGDLIEATAGRSGRVSSIAVGADSKWSGEDGNYLFLMDRRPFDSSWRPGMFAHVQPEQVRQYLEAHNQLFRLNQKVEEWLNDLPEEQWVRKQLPTGEGLDAIWVEPVKQ